LFISTATSTDEAARAADVAVLPVGSFEQHGDHLPLATDSLIACIIAKRVAEDYNLFLLPPITIGCSHEHAGWPGTVSISAATLYGLVNDIAASVRASGAGGLLVVNGHGGNYVLSNVVQESSAAGWPMALFPTRDDWRAAREAAGCQTDTHADMHAGELETSMLLYAAPDLVRSSYREADHEAPERPHLLTLGMSGYTPTGVIGRPSSATTEKGKLAVEALAELAGVHVELLTGRKS
jgi:creatinine amidohydrolase